MRGNRSASKTKHKAVDELNETSDYSKRGIETGLKPAYTVKACDFFPHAKEPRMVGTLRMATSSKLGETILNQC